MQAPDVANAASELPERLERQPGVVALRAAAGSTPAYLVGGAVRDLLLGVGRTDIDVAVEGDPLEIAGRLGGAVRSHARFGTATARVDDLDVDLARTRAETYPAPGALPTVREASLAEDLARRDFTVNAMAVPLNEAATLVDPHGGLEDLTAGVLRVLHPRSFVDDPTRALRAARYAARLGLGLDAETAELLRAADLDTVSSERVEAELHRVAAEPQALAAVGMLVDWGLAQANLSLASKALAVAAVEPFARLADSSAVLLAAAGVRAGRYRAPDVSAAAELAAVRAGTPSELTLLAHGRTAPELVTARALGADWLDDYVGEWRGVRLEIGGSDLLAAGVPEGPAIGRGLSAALRSKLDGELAGREAELAAALAAASGG
jgi:tRNA nucleotidyltransferase (CCA-adding enzyme)